MKPQPDGPDRVLFISDDDQFAAAVRFVLEQERLSVICCGPEDDVAHLMHEVRPELVLAHVDPNRSDPLEAIRVLGGGDDSFPVPAVALSSDRSLAVQALELGAYDLVETPIEAGLLTAAVRRAIEASALKQYQRDHRRILEQHVEEVTLRIGRDVEFFKGMLDSSALVSVILTDLDQTVRFWNSGAEKIFGYTAEEMVGGKITRLYPPDSISAETVAHLRDVVSTKSGTIHGRMRQVAKDGRLLTILLAVSPMVDKHGEVTGILGIGQDVTEEARLTEELRKSLHLIKKTQDASIFSLAKLAESRDEETGLHLLRLQEYCRVLCAQMALLDDYRAAMTPEFIDDLVRSSVLHDIGKVGIPDSVLLCPDKFGPEELAVMRRHPEIGGLALAEAVEKLGEESFLSVGSDIAYYHHERWDGTGYPYGLKGEEIPLAARIVAIADVYDALTIRRRYKEAYSHEEACNIIEQGGGTHFDPAMTAVFREVHPDFSRIRQRFTD